jgi:hypothetical protein
MVEINNMNDIDDYDNDSLGNNNRRIVVGVDRFPSFLRTLENPSFSLTKFGSKFALKYLSATIRFLKWKFNKLKLKIKEKNAIIRYDGWWIPQVESNLQDARRGLQNEKQSNEEKDGHIQLVTLQKKQHIQTMKRLKNKVNAAKVKADQRELGLNSQNISLNVIIWISASYLEHIPMIPMKCRPPYLSYI